MSRQKKLTFLTAGYADLIGFSFCRRQSRLFRRRDPAWRPDADRFGLQQRTRRAVVLCDCLSRSRRMARGDRKACRVSIESIAAAQAAAITPPVISLKPGEAPIVNVKDLAVRLPNGTPLLNASDLVDQTGRARARKRSVRLRKINAVPRARRHLALWRRHDHGSEKCACDDPSTTALFSDRAACGSGRISSRARHFRCHQSGGADRCRRIAIARPTHRGRSALESHAVARRTAATGNCARPAHAPDFLFLDEATASLDEPAEAELYQLLDRRLANATIVSIGHRATLTAFHKRRLAFRRDGNQYAVREAALAPAG